MAKFLIKNVFFFKAKDILFIIGDITEGTIKIGMRFNLRDIEFIINHLEFVDGKENDVPYSHIALGITPNDKSFFDSILSENNQIEIEIR
jgi:hypothetical protein